MHTQKDCENWQKEIQLSLDKKALAKRKKTQIMEEIYRHKRCKSIRGVLQV